MPRVGHVPFETGHPAGQSKTGLILFIPPSLPTTSPGTQMAHVSFFFFSHADACETAFLARLRNLPPN